MGAFSTNGIALPTTAEAIAYITSASLASLAQAYLIPVYNPGGVKYLKDSASYADAMEGTSTGPFELDFILSKDVACTYT